MSLTSEGENKPRAIVLGDNLQERNERLGQLFVGDTETKRDRAEQLAQKLLPTTVLGVSPEACYEAVLGRKSPYLGEDAPDDIIDELRKQNFSPTIIPVKTFDSIVKHRMKHEKSTN